MELETAKTAALLAYLILTPGTHARHKLAGLLWGELSEGNANRDLRHALWNLRRALCSTTAAPVLDITVHSVAFNSHAGCYVDALTFQHLIQLRQPHVAMTHYRGDLLDGFYVHNAPAFEEWLLAKREGLRIASMFALCDLVKACHQRGDFRAGLLYARRVLECDPWREEAHRDVMTMLALDGNPAAALAQFDTLAHLLEHELGAKPTAATRRLYQAIRDGNHTALLQYANAGTTSTPGSGARIAFDWRDALNDPGCPPESAGVASIDLNSPQELPSAQNLSYDFADGIFYVDLHPTALPEGLMIAIAQALKVQIADRAFLFAQLARYLRNKHLLLVVNVISLPQQTREVMSNLLAEAPGVAVLVSPRDVLVKLHGDAARANQGVANKTWIYPCRLSWISPSSVIIGRHHGRSGYGVRIPPSA